MMLKMIQEIEKLKKESQSPQIGSMFLTCNTKEGDLAMPLRVAIPSNRVNVSYKEI